MLLLYFTLKFTVDLRVQLLHFCFNIWPSHTLSSMNLRSRFSSTDISDVYMNNESVFYFILFNLHLLYHCIINLLCLPIRGIVHCSSCSHKCYLFFGFTYNHNFTCNILCAVLERETWYGKTSDNATGPGLVVSNSTVRKCSKTKIQRPEK